MTYHSYARSLSGARDTIAEISFPHTSICSDEDERLINRLDSDLHLGWSTSGETLERRELNSEMHHLLGSLVKHRRVKSQIVMLRVSSITV